jgi:hypothetical protein
MWGTGRHEARGGGSAEGWLLLIVVALWHGRQPGAAAGPGTGNPVAGAAPGRLAMCEARLAAAEARLDEYDQAWAAMGPLRAASGDDGHRHGMHAVRRELPG